MKFLRETLWVGWYETVESVRTRLFQIVILAYIGAVGASNALFVAVVKEMEEHAAEAMGVPATTRPGAMLGSLVEQGELDEMVEFIGGNTELLQWHPLVLWASASGMFILPAVLTFTSATSLAEEVKTRSIRYLACRTGRLQIGLGKFLGQLQLGLVAVLCGGVVSLAIGGLAMTGLPLGRIALELLELTPRILLFSVPMVGLGLCASQLMSSGNAARIVALIGLIGLQILDSYLANKVGLDTAGRLADLARMLLPAHGWSAYWSLDWTELLGGMGRSLALGLLYFSAGFMYFQRRDL
jgi:ABC-type transport system involved in multi-copper enzyme maturation permease subunit